MAEGKTCGHCGADISRRHHNARFCNTECRRAAKWSDPEWLASKRSQDIARAKRYRAENPEKIREIKRNAYASNPRSHRSTRYKSVYGLSLAEYEALHAAQGGLCAICSRPERQERNGKLIALAVDHCHVSGRVRGLLCARCNKGIGLLDDSPELLDAGAAYLRQHQSAQP